MVRNLGGDRLVQIGELPVAHVLPRRAESR
jgi:hypothetical protein